MVCSVQMGMDSASRVFEGFLFYTTGSNCIMNISDK